jgi:hypothetical protein
MKYLLIVLLAISGAVLIHFLAGDTERERLALESRLSHVP